MEFIFRFFVGGLIVSLFAVLSDVLKPKSFAGLFAAAPSVALATLGLTILAEGKLYAAAESRSMIVGAIALFVYAFIVIQLIMKFKLHAASASIGAIPVWLLCAIGTWFLMLRQMPMSIQVDLRALKMTKWSEYALRFLFGGGITVITGVLAERYGPEFGGLFLAFPALFVASSTLIEKHERERKEKSGIAKTIRGRQAAALDARGVTMGSIGLIGFALVVWELLPIWNGDALLAALVVWLVISILIWRLRKSLC